MKAFTYTFCLVSSIFFVSCSIQKRTVNKGYFVQWHKGYSNPNQKDEQKTIPLKNTDETDFAVADSGQENRFSMAEIQLQDEKVSKSGGKSLLKSIKEKQETLIPEDSCVDLVLKNGELFPVKIVKNEAKKILYSDCEDPNAEIKSITKKELILILHADGTKEYLDDKVVDKGTGSKMDDLAGIVLLAGVVSFLIVVLSGSVASELVFLIAAIALMCTLVIAGHKSEEPLKKRTLSLIITGLLLGLLAVIGVLIQQ